MSHDEATPRATEASSPRTLAMATEYSAFLPDYHELASKLLNAARLNRKINQAHFDFLRGINVGSMTTSDHLDHYSVGFRGYRQTGKSRFACNTLKNGDGSINDNVIIVATNRENREDLLQRCGVGARTQIVTGKDILNDLKSKSGSKLVLEVEMVASQDDKQVSVLTMEQLRAHALAYLQAPPHLPLPGQNHVQSAPTVERYVTEKFTRMLSPLMEEDHPVRRGTLVIVDEAYYVQKFSGCSLEDISKWSRAGGMVPEIVTIN